MSLFIVKYSICNLLFLLDQIKSDKTFFFKKMDLDEWTQEYDEWDIPDFQPYTGEAPALETKPEIQKTVKSGPFPEIEINSSSDDEAPPPPPSTQLARENLVLREKMTNLKRQTQNAETMNQSLKRQLSNFRNIFKNQMNRSVLTVFK